MNPFSRIIDQIVLEDFSIPLLQKEKDYFPDFLKTQLSKFIEFYEKKLLPHVDEGINFSSGNKDVIISKIRSLSYSINKSVEYFYAGDILRATQTFNKGLDDVFFKDLAELNIITKIEEQTKFYRSRIGEKKKFTRSDLFHVNFNLRHIVSTNRYSIPGFPALYFGDNSYICWEEFNQPELKNLNFSLFKNTRPLKIIQLLRIEDLLSKLTENKSENIPFLLTYFTFFPLTIASSIKVKHASGNFKPEYIIPQLLLQYISEDKEIDGLKFPSTKIDYSKLHNMSPYNYVFPVKTVKQEGYCDVLKDTFHCTQPTSLNLEEIRYNPFGTVHLLPASTDDRKIELIEDLKSPYSKTSFGRLEYFLEKRELKKI
ncbi:hypothetical protein [Flavobacterium eburneipallidum]|uniref:hypothetical protein n=1 Tax=Flavobacterium eburneipallidum TaxID=3003263 RepID=UPI0022ABC6A5|nr:hypothetical protein [Flavobacterium eburneipallidum]